MQRLYLKYRPKNFENVIGQSHVVGPVKNALLNNSFPRSVLFYGIHGTGKTTLARIVAMFLNCSGEDKPCLECSSCKAILDKRSQDVIEINAADHRGIGDIRNIIDRAQYAPIGKAKIFILDEVHRLTVDAQNSLLKILEEPPSDVYFVLATTEVDKLLPTILSRCQRHDLRRVTSSEIEERLSTICGVENKQVDDKILNYIAGEAKGSVRDAITLLEKIFEHEEVTVENFKELLGQAKDETTFSFVECLLDRKVADAFAVIETAVTDGTNLEQFMSSVEELLQKVLYAKVCNTDDQNFKSLADKTTSAFLVSCFNALTKWRTRFMPIQRLTFEVAVTDVCSVPQVVATQAPQPVRNVFIPSKVERPWEQQMTAEPQAKESKPVLGTDSF